MRVFIDACIDPKVVELFAGHEVKTALELGRHRLKDHILASMIQDQFDVFVTLDRGFEYEHNLQKLRFGIVIVHVPKNTVEYYRPMRSRLQAAVEQVGRGEIVHVYVPPD